ncbi:hypothetical protein [Parazoarcus communis]|uniref:Uncharacterized protein n=1 Tax=Parazoarcus communis SWub3 = DSM 12120 TaxID=1121029 RepID=A0A323UTD7_9RHOO|nr:hypothetical protein [Parazoarcus communis]NMG71817.1 hypothetical protein [Parazoarcus communis SWub3 = DSM 12120]PZA14930.1 hypothetical protein DNK49_18980 [Azoarcus communis] [Parazoarcus communis SWub3 = DSM 12120]
MIARDQLIELAAVLLSLCLAMLNLAGVVELSVVAITAPMWGLIVLSLVALVLAWVIRGAIEIFEMVRAGRGR